jgi:UDP-N-acetylglucosamine--N-acetylmuramyl-(pentapeptide) pyrophosphoryl-undecaprenol N-acetylglucosamine transferase
VRRLRPRVVVGFGGYASLPTVVAARALRVPSVVHEQNAAPGLANRIAVSLGARAAGAMSGVALRGAVVTGNPVRPEILEAARRPAEPAQPLQVLVASGSLGARSVNLAALGLYEQWRDRDDVAVRHVSGRRDHAECVDRLSGSRRPSDRLHYELVEYEHDMPAAYERSAIFVGRAGATTVAELAAVGMPSVLVPLPGAPGDHQTANAERLAAGGAALVLPDDRCTADALADLLGPLVTDPARLTAMGAAARDLARPDAAERLADLVEGAARG